jgi:prevent-host-death family protein
MQEIGLFDAKNRLSELVERAARGEKIGIKRRGKLTAVIGPAQENPDRDAKEIFASIERIRRSAKPLPKGLTIKRMIEEGRI